MVLPWYYHGIPQFLDTNICKVYCKLSQYPRREPAFVSNPGWAPQEVAQSSSALGSTDTSVARFFRKAMEFEA
jgi:hypothetical protein